MAPASAGWVTIRYCAFENFNASGTPADSPGLSAAGAVAAHTSPPPGTTTWPPPAACSPRAQLAPWRCHSATVSPSAKPPIANGELPPTVPAKRCPTAIVWRG